MFRFLTEKGLASIEQAQADLSAESAVTRACWITFWSCIGLSTIEIACGALGYNPLLIIDGLTSSAFAVVATTILLGSHLSRSENISKNYSYGKGKAQFLLCMIVGILFGIAALVILGVSIKGFSRPVLIESLSIGITIVFVVIVGKILLLFYLRHVGNNSTNLEFGKCGRLLALSIASSVTVIQSFFLIAYGWILGERIGRISISLMMVCMSILIIKDALDGIMDRRTGDKTEAKIKDLARSVESVREAYWVRTRRIGENIHIDLQVGLDKNCTIGQSDIVAAKIIKLISTKLEQPQHAINVEFVAV